MRPTPLILFTLFIVIISTGLRLEASYRHSSMGKVFWVSYMENSTDPGSLNIQIAAERRSLVTLSIPVLGDRSFTLEAGHDTVVVFPNNLVYVTGSESVQNKGVRIKSDENISVIAHNIAPFSSDATLVYPLDYIPGGSRYWINTYRGSAGFPSQCMIIATDDSTLVEITPSVQTRGGRVAGVPFFVLLNRGQTYQIQAQGTGNLSGTLVRTPESCKKIVVFSGSRCAQGIFDAGCSGCDHLWSQELPQSHWGKSHVSAPLYNMNRGYYFQILASENNTQVTANGVLLTQLNQGEFYGYEVQDNTPICFESSAAVSIIQLVKSAECNGHPQGRGDPSLFHLTPQEQWTTQIRFRLFLTNNMNTGYTTLLSTDLSTLEINDLPLTAYNIIDSQTLCNNLKSVTFVAQQGGYTLRSSVPYYAYQYAYGNAESYVTAAGSSMENQQLRFEMDPPLTELCGKSEVFRFNAGGSNLYRNHRWEFGDNSTAQGIQNILHTYQNYGSFRIMLIAEKPDQDCIADTFFRDILIHEPPYVNLGSDTIICDEVEYLIIPSTSDDVSFLWHNGSTEPTLLIARDEFVTLRVQDSNDCIAEDSAWFRLDPCLEKKVLIPNVFTPGNDGYNDEFRIIMEVYTQAECIIYNRWGTEIYRYNPARDRHWNGGIANDNSRPCSSGTYFFLLRFTDPDTQEEFSMSGTIQLIREP